MAARLPGRRILVTGGGSGIGLATTRLFVREGARVAAVDRDEAALARAVAVRETGADFLSIVADVTDDRQVREAIDRAAQALGGIDGVVNAAGVDLVRAFDEATVDDWQRVLAVNLLGPVAVCRAAVPAIRGAGGGTIVNVASGAGLRPLEKRTAYCSSKAALVMFGKALALELAPDGIRVNAVCPGVIDTPMFRASYEGAADPDAELARILDRFAIKRVGKAIDVANAALFLSCEESAHMTGSALAVDGGRAFH